VYVYRYDCSSGSWGYEAKLLADDGAEQDHFGHSVAVSGDRIVVGAPGKDGTCDATDAGAAYVFEYDGAWSQEVSLTTCSLDAYDYFGYSVDIDEDLVIVGAYGDDDDGEESGAAYIFRHSCSCWCEDTKLTADDGHAYAQFGYDVAINVRYGSCGDFAVVGAPEHFSSTYAAGKAYVYEGGGPGCWVEEDTFEADPDHDNEDFGRAVAIDNTRIMIGASTEDTAAGHTGCAYVYEDDDEDGARHHDRHGAHVRLSFHPGTVPGAALTAGASSGPRRLGGRPHAATSVSRNTPLRAEPRQATESAPEAGADGPPGAAGTTTATSFCISWLFRRNLRASPSSVKRAANANWLVCRSATVARRGRCVRNEACIGRPPVVRFAPSEVGRYGLSARGCGVAGPRSRRLGSSFCPIGAASLTTLGIGGDVQGPPGSDLGVPRSHRSGSGRMSGGRCARMVGIVAGQAIPCLTAPLGQRAARLTSRPVE